MRRLFFALLLIAPSAFAQINDTYVIPAAGNIAGAFGTQWRTRLSLFNPQSYALHISATLLPTGGGQGLTAMIAVPSNAVALYDNVLADVFQYQGGGALLVAAFAEDNPGIPDEAVSLSFLANSETYNNTSAGTFGQTIPGVFTGLQDYASDQISAIAHGIRNSNTQAWRTNVGAVNLSRNNIIMRVTVYDVDGRTILKDAPFSIPPFGHFQDRLPVAVDRGSIEFFVDDPTQEAVVFPYTSTIDQLSGDPSYQSPPLLATAGFLFGKKALVATVGKKITSADARAARLQALPIRVTPR